MLLVCGKEHSSVSVPRPSLTVLSPSDLGQDSERARLSGASPRVPVFGILDQSLLAGVTVSRYVIKLRITLHNVFSRWARIRKGKKKIYNYIKDKYPLPNYL